MPAPYTDPSSRFASSNISTEVGGLTFSEGVQKMINLDGKDLGITLDRSSVQLSHRDGAGIKFEAGGKARIETSTDLDVMVTQNKNESVKGDKQVFVGRNFLTAVDGNFVGYIGKQGQTEIEATKKLAELAVSLQKQAVEAAQSAVAEKVKCPTCTQWILEDTQTKTEIAINRAINYVADKIPWMTDWLERVVKLMSLVPKFPRAKKMAAYVKDKSCGPGCKSHMVEGVGNAMRAAEKSILDGLKANEDLILENCKKLGQGGGAILTTKGAIVINAGLAKNDSDVFFKKGVHSFPIGFADGKNGGPMVYTSSGCDRMVHVEPARTGNQGDMFLNVSEKFSVNAGSPGVDIITKGMAQIKAGGVHIQAVDGEAHFGSNNLTVIDGRSVKINGGGPKSSVVLDADYVHMAKIASVGSTLNVKGAINADGTLSIPFLNVPSADQRVSMSKTSQMAASVSNTWFMNSMQRCMSFAKDLAGKITMPIGTWMMNIDNLTSFTQECLDVVLSVIPFDPIPAGISMVFTFGIGNLGYPVISWGIGMFGAPFCPVFLFPHNHSKFSMEHAGSVTVPLGNYFDTVQGVNQARGVSSPIPSFADMEGNIGTRPGNISNPGPCGGGGMYTKDRNLNYGIDSLDSFAGGNGLYVNRYASLSSRNQSLSGGFVDLLPPIEPPDISYYTYGLTKTSGCNDSEGCSSTNL